MGDSAIYEGSIWRIYDVSLGTEMCSAENAENICSDKQCKREGLPHVAVAVRDDSAFGGTNNLQVSTLD